MIAGAGVDLCEVARIARAIDGRTGAAFRQRVFTDGERAYCEQRRGAARDQSYAARFAAKEAALKALGTGWGQGLGWHDVEVERAGDGAPTLRLHGPAAALAAERGIVRWHLSLSHTAALAIAWVIAETADPTADAPAARSAAAEKPAAAAGSRRRPPTRRR